ncbi:MAG: alpha/beta fold hydrolase [Kiritimatiellae bacterium]|nr:alpha/beta fold hydrolase [Kiritimatiellia bacterium]
MKLRCLLLLSVLPAITVSANPVVFLHGWNSNGSIWDAMSELLVSDAGYSADDFLKLNYYSSNNSSSPCSTSSGINDVAAFVAGEVIDFFQSRGGRSVDIVAHSMGGLVARSMLANGYIETNCVRRLVAIATPHYGQAATITFQAQQMKYGSKFLWDLAEDWHFKGNVFDEVLCVAGVASKTSGSYWDGLVHSWSAALGDTPCRYVDCYHASTFSILGSVIYACKKGTKDPVYKLVKNFLTEGTVLDQTECYEDISGVVTNHGGLFYQVVRNGGTPVAYASSVDALVTKFYRPDTAVTVTPDDLEHGYNNESQQYGLEMLFGNVKQGRLRLTVKASDGFDGFDYDGAEIKGGRVGVYRLERPFTLFLVR